MKTRTTTILSTNLHANKERSPKQKTILKIHTEWEIALVGGVLVYINMLLPISNNNDKKPYEASTP